MNPRATNRQRKLLKFFGVEYHEDISVGAAGWDVRRLLSNASNSLLWDKYLFLTGDYSTETDEVFPYDPLALQKVELPQGWDSQKAVRDFQSDFVEFILDDESPFDCPQPKLSFKGKQFCFTGKFAYGERRSCVAAIEAKGGIFSKSVVVGLDYLVLGSLGNSQWVRESYGRKIERAVLLRREQGVPAIVSEEHWVKSVSRK